MATNNNKDDDLGSSVNNFWTTPSRDRTLLLLRMNIAAYPTCTEKINHFHTHYVGAANDNDDTTLRGVVEPNASCSYPIETLQPIFANGQSIYGSNITTLQQENNATLDWELENWNLLTTKTTTNDTNDNEEDSGSMGLLKYKIRSIPLDTARFDIGVSAMEWTATTTTATPKPTTSTATTTTKILVFRGTYSLGDYNNIEHWMVDYLLEKSTDRMKHAWIHDANLTWTSDMNNRYSDDTLSKIEIRTGLRIQSRTFPQQLVDAVSSSSISSSSSNDTSLNDTSPLLSLTLDDAQSTGYWKITKYIVDQVYAETQANNQSLVLTGHSQGGTRAQLASMYLYHKYGVKVPTVTFAATGSACSARHLWHSHSSGSGTRGGTSKNGRHSGGGGGGNFLNDVDPYTVHDQIVEYVHPLDPWGNSMLGHDNGGQVCYFGSSQLQQAQQQQAQQQINGDGDDDGNDNQSSTNNDPTFEYCSQIYGYPGPVIVANEHGPRPNLDLKHNFKRCRYYTHNPKAMFLNLQRELNDDGTTYSGCQPLNAIPMNDPTHTCPVGALSWEEEEVIGILVVVVLLGIMIFCFGCCKCWVCLWNRKMNRNKNTVSGYDLSPLSMDDSDDDEDDDGYRMTNGNERYTDDEPAVSIELPSIS